MILSLSEDIKLEIRLIMFRFKIDREWFPIKYKIWKKK